jgi:hypothetical protein
MHFWIYPNMFRQVIAIITGAVVYSIYIHIQTAGVASEETTTP